MFGIDMYCLEVENSNLITVELIKLVAILLFYNRKLPVTIQKRWNSSNYSTGTASCGLFAAYFLHLYSHLWGKLLKLIWYQECTNPRCLLTLVT